MTKNSTGIRVDDLNVVVEVGQMIWEALDTVVAQTALRKRTWPVDRAACARIIDLSGELGRNETTEPGSARLAAELILAGYRREQFDDVELTLQRTAATLAKHPAKLIAMLTDPERGIAEYEPNPPDVETLAAWMDEMSLRVMIAARLARQAIAREDAVPRSLQ